MNSSHFYRIFFYYFLFLACSQQKKFPNVPEFPIIWADKYRKATENESSQTASPPELKELVPELKSIRPFKEQPFAAPLFHSTVTALFQHLLKGKRLSEQKKFTNAFHRLANISAATLGLDYIIRFFLSCEENELFVALHQGKTAVESPLIPMLSPPELEFFLFRLNQVSEKTGIPLKPQHSYNTSKWIVPPLLNLKRDSSLFYRLKTRQLTEKEINTICHNQEPDFHTRLLQSFIFLQFALYPDLKTDSGLTLISLNRNRRGAEKIITRIAVTESEELLQLAENAAIEAEKYALSPFQNHLIRLHLSFLARQQKQTEKEMLYLEQALKYHEDPDLHLSLSVKYKEQKNWEKAYFHGNQARRNHPDASIPELPTPNIARISEKPTPIKSPEPPPKKTPVNPPVHPVTKTAETGITGPLPSKSAPSPGKNTPQKQEAKRPEPQIQYPERQNKNQLGQIPKILSEEWLKLLENTGNQELRNFPELHEDYFLFLLLRNKLNKLQTFCFDFSCKTLQNPDVTDTLSLFFNNPVPAESLTERIQQAAACYKYSPPELKEILTIKVLSWLKFCVDFLEPEILSPQTHLNLRQIAGDTPLQPVFENLLKHFPIK
jgi:hypothetical protein